MLKYYTIGQLDNCNNNTHECFDKGCVDIKLLFLKMADICKHSIVHMHVCVLYMYNDISSFIVADSRWINKVKAFKFSWR